ncbi:hypothetical protein TELCIR_16993, partial [Teladorsagia circumcincta]
LLPAENILDMKNDEFPEPVFVTAMSDNHSKEGLTLIANIRKLWPQRKILIYDLGLSSRSLKELEVKCLLEIRKFPFANFPSYVKNLGEFRWKPLIIAMTLKEFGAVWYMDTSIRWKKDRLNLVYDEIRCRKDHSWPESVNITYVLCALEKNCMAPPGAQLSCRFGENRFNHYAGCHRYDQSVINLLLANSYGYNAKNYVSCLGAEGATVNRTASNSLTANDFLCDLRV